MSEFNSFRETFKSSTVPELLFSACGLYGARTALVDAFGAREISFDQLVADVLALSLRLAAQVTPQSVVAIAGEGNLSFQVAVLAGATQHVVAPLGSSNTHGEYRRQLEATCAELVVTTSPVPALVSAAQELNIQVSALEEIREIQVSRAGLDYHPLPDDRAAIFLTSGSTAQPKAIPLTHQNLTSSARSVARSLGLAPTDRCLTMWEQDHIGGIVDLLLAPLFSGGCVINGGSFSLPMAFKLLKSEKPTWMQFVPTTLSETVNEVHRVGMRPAWNLRFVRCVAAPLPDALFHRAQSALGCPIVITYGLTEAGPLVSSTSASSWSRKPGSSGKPVSVEVKIVGSDNTVLPPDSVGEIAIRGESVFDAYVGSSSEVFLRPEESFYRTGDLGYLDDSGELFVVGREKFLINRGGEKINPLEVESALLEHEEVDEAAVFGVPHPTLGESIEAALVLRNPVSSGALRAHLKSRLAHYKIPVVFHPIKRLPVTAIGKLDRSAIPSSVAERIPAFAKRNNVELEQIIRRIWMTELDVKKLSTLRSFESSGGDSLSALRVGVEIENELGLKSGVIRIHGWTTIRSLSRQIDLVGIPARSPSNGEAVFPPVTTWTRMAVKELAETFIEGTPHDGYRELAQQAALTTFTAGELRELVRLIEKRVPGFLDPTQPLLRWGPSGEKENLENLWHRDRLGPEVMSYRREVSEPIERVLLAFTGNMGRLMLPIHLILEELPRDFGQVLLVTDSSARHYEFGIADVAATAHQLPHALRSFIPEVGAKNLSILGTSAGALAALTTGLAWRVNLIGLVGPDRVKEHLVYREMIERFSTERNPSSRVCIRFGRNSRDLAGALSLKSILRFSKLSMSLRSGHSVLMTDYRRNRLGSSLAWLLGS